MTPKKVSRPLAEFGCRENWGESHLLLHSSLLLHQRESPNPRFPDQLYVLPFSGFRTIWAKMWFSHSFQFQIWIYQKNYFLNITLPHSILSFFFIAASLSSLRSSSIPIRPPFSTSASTPAILVSRQKHRNSDYSATIVWISVLCTAEW